tara:strand:+ start:61384 stop:61902 length:519 start_codon:yes stop_codon:yes gene_type:complete
MKRILSIFLFFNLLTNCNGQQMEDLKPVKNVDIQRFMGKWYVIAIIPNWIEKNPYNSIEEYSLNEKGYIDVKYTFNQDGFDGKKRILKQKAFIKNLETKSEWEIQPFWPLRFPYYIIDLDENYSYTVIGYPNRKLLWIMSREKTISNENFKLIDQNLLNQGYDLNYIKIPHN